MRKKRANPEEQLHRAVADYLRQALQPPTIWTTLGHGGGGRVRGAKLKAMGLQAGWPDILIMHPGVVGRCLTRVLGIELKAGKGSLSDGQRDMMGRFGDAQAIYHVCRSLEAVQLAIELCGIPLRATVQARAA